MGDDLLAQLREKQPELFAMERQLVDSAVTFLTQALDERVLSTSRTALDDMLGQTQQQTDVLIARAAASIRGDLNQSLQAMLDDNFELAEVRGARLAEILVTTAILEATRSIDTLLVAAITTASRSIQRDLSPVLLGIVDHLTDSLTVKIRELQDALEDTGRGIGWGIILVVAGIVVLGLIAFFVRRAFKKEKDQVANVLFRTIHQLPPGEPITVEGLKDRIKKTAKQDKAYGHLTQRLEQWESKQENKPLS